MLARITRVVATVSATSLALAALITVAAARSDQATAIIDTQIAEACFGNAGTISEDAGIERDLTGDGKDDLIVYHRGIWCKEGGQSGFCGAQLCSILIYVREGSGLVLKLDTMTGTLELSDGDVPSIGLAAHGGEMFTIRWNGAEFEY